MSSLVGDCRGNHYREITKFDPLTDDLEKKMDVIENQVTQLVPSEYQTIDAGFRKECLRIFGKTPAFSGAVASIRLAPNMDRETIKNTLNSK